MSGSDLDIPDANGWAKSPARVVADPAWRRREKPRFRWLAWVGGLAALSLIGAGAMLMLGGEPASPGEVPLITAEPGPVRIRPDDPGGMQVPNLDKRVYDQLAQGGGQAAQRAAPRVESLLPPPEVPRPVPLPPPALPAQPAALTDGPTEAERAREPEQPATPPAQSAAAPPAPGAPRAAQPPSAAPAPPTPAPAQVAAAPPQAPTPTPSQSPTGRVQVQLAAVPTEQAAASEWNRLRRRMPELLANQSLVVSRGEREGQPFWRVRTGGFEDNAAARAFCERVKAAGGSCFVAPAS